MNRHIFRGSSVNRDARDAAFELAKQNKPRPDLRCEHGHSLYEYHDLEPGVGHRLLCPVCDRDYIRELREK